MCTNSALVDSLECCLEDMVDCFEDFVKKSLVIITLAVGALVGMLVYLLKIMNERNNEQVVAAGGQRLSNHDSGQMLGEAGRGQWDDTAVAGQWVGTAVGGQLAGTAVGGHRMNEADREYAISRGPTGPKYTEKAYTGKVASKFYENMSRNRERLVNREIKSENNDEKDQNIRSIRDYKDERYAHSDRSRDKRIIKTSGSQSSLKSSTTRQKKSDDDDKVSIKGEKVDVIERTASNNSLHEPKRAASRESQKSSSKCSMNCPKKFLTTHSSPKVCIGKNSSSCVHCSSASVVSSCDEVTKDCSEMVCPKKASQLKKMCPRSSSGTNCKSRLAIPSLPTCQIPKRHLVTPRPCTKPVSDRYSCCSVCCDDDPR